MNALPTDQPMIDKKFVEPAFVPKSVTIPATIRVGSVPYLNAKPLTRFIVSDITQVEPVQLAKQLRDGQLDVALVPIMEVLESPADTYRIINGLAIGSEREVYSVYLNHTVPIGKIQTVALDPASKTSVELVRIVLERFHRLEPKYVSAHEPADAQLLIGDPAIAQRQTHPELNYLDLATAWREYTGLPFVFAAWASRLPSYWKALSLARQLRTAGKAGISWRDSIAHNPFERKYLTRHLCYDLGPDQKRSIALFGDFLAQSGRIASAPKLNYI